MFSLDWKIILPLHTLICFVIMKTLFDIEI